MAHKALSVLTLGLAMAWSIAAAVADDGLPRLVSLDYCADQYVLAIADPGQILALSTEATHVHSFYRDRAKGLPSVRAEAEQVLALRPELVVRNWGGDARLLGLLQKAEIPVVTADYGSAEAVMLENVRRFAGAMGRRAEGERMAAEVQAKLEAIRDLPPLGLTAAYLAPGGVTAGPGTFVDDILIAAGIDTSAARLGLEGWQNLPLESFMQNPPDVIVATFFDLKQATASNWALTRHHRLRELMERIPVIEVPGRYFSCNGMFQAETVRYLRDRAEALIGKEGA